MGRSNKAARTRNAKGRLNRREKGGVRMGPPINHSIERVSAEDLIVPDGSCLRNSRKPKAKFNTEAKAKAALIQAQKMRSRMGSGHVEKRYYLCPADEGGCGAYHLTSRETYDNLWKKATP